jgi:PhnB protein
MSIKPIPDGFHAITPYLFAHGAPRLIEFICAAFDGELIFGQTRPDGAIMNATMRIGDSMLMLADATPPFGPMPASIYLYVHDSDAVYHSALNAGVVILLGIPATDMTQPLTMADDDKELPVILSIMGRTLGFPSATP